MAKEWSVTTEKLVSSANVIEEKTGKYRAEWQKLYTELQNLRSAQWKGVASDTFNDKLEGYRNDFQAMEDVLKQYAGFLKSAADSYTKTENSLKDAAGNLNTGN
ncbi:type VII secretion system target protein [Fusobacterium sp. CM21]|nr:type VII secretion system target protein [Fusobacterium sp. CM21]